MLTIYITAPKKGGIIMGCDCGCGGTCGVCEPRLKREIGYRSEIIMKTEHFELPKKQKPKNKKK